MGGSIAGIKDWCEDCIYLLDIMCTLMAEKEPQIRDKGLRYFARKNYKLASMIKSPIGRFKAYHMINRTFSYCLSPIQYIYYRDINPLRIKAIRRIKEIIHH